ncbi:MAG: TIM barrel protein, partial [Candidatus Marinimicrobia bacterium]|nr:TIM barrel protein [Candidatus Neomarinimicrobiota bacterium]
MKITKLINKFIVFKESNIFDALNKINQNKRGAVFILDYDGTLKGMITDGIFRRWATENKKFNLEDCVTEIMNTDITTHLASDNTSAINESFSKKVKIIPLIDDKRRLVSIAVMEDDSIQIGKHTISEGSSCFIIAEIGNNHNGDIELAKNMVDLAVEAGADCVKFQMRNVGKLYKNNGKSDDISADLGTQYVLDLLCRFQLSNNDLLEVFDYCKGKGKEPLCTPWDLESLKILEDYGMLAYKVSSADMTNTELLAALSRTNKPLICSTGMSTEVEIKNSIAFLNDQGARYIMLHCNSTYPTPFKDVNLSYLSRLRRISGNPVGYSGHERGFITPVVAVGLGACIIEKHFTIDKNMEGNDHKVSLLPNEFKEMVDQIRLVEEVMGTDSERFISQGESMNREVLAKSLVINQNLNAGEVITREMIEVKSPGQGLQPYLINELVGKKAKKFFSFGDYFFLSDIQDNLVVARNYKFNRPFGIPVRYHDYMGLSSKTNVDFIEFHLSYKDLEEDISALFDKVQDIGFAVHSPELFFGDHILNLCSNDLKYLNHSINELQNVVNITRTLKPYFPNTKRPVIVTNVGGFSNDGFLPKEKRIEMYEKISNSLDKIDSENVEIIIQTMPPFPWHFGGQGFHNLFVNPNEIAAFCEKTGYRICLDISHSQMACSFYKWSLEDFIKKVGKY